MVCVIVRSSPKDDSHHPDVRSLGGVAIYRTRPRKCCQKLSAVWNRYFNTIKPKTDQVFGHDSRLRTETIRFGTPWNTVKREACERIVFGVPSESNLGRTGFVARTPLRPPPIPPGCSLDLACAASRSGCSRCRSMGLSCSRASCGTALSHSVQ